MLLFKLKAHTDSITPLAFSQDLVRALMESIVFKGMIMPGDTYLRYLTTVAPIRAIAVHDFQFIKNHTTHIAIKFNSAYIEGSEDTIYSQETASQDWRTLSADDPMCMVVQHKGQERYHGEYVSNIKTLSKVQEERRYERFVIGHTIYSIAFYDDQIEPQLRPALMDIIQQGIINHVASELNHIQISFCNILKAKLHDDYKSYASYLQILLENSARLLYEYFGFVNVRYKFSPEVSSVLGEDICQKAEFSFFEEGPQLSRDTQLLPIDYSENIEVEKYNHDWQNNEEILGFTLELLSSVYRDIDMEKALGLKKFSETLSYTLYEFFNQGYASLRKTQSNEHKLRTQLVRHAKSLPELITTVKKTINAYFDKAELAFVYAEIICGNNIVKSASDNVPVQQRKESNVISILHDGNYEVCVLLPKESKILLKRSQERFDDYVEDVKDAFKNILSRYDQLTGLWNQSVLMTTLESDISFIQSTPGTYLTVVWADIYKFKIINELFGHWFADEWLKYNAKNLSQLAPFAARLHGDEHVLVFRYYDEATVASEAERLLLEAQGYVSQSEYEHRYKALEVFCNNQAISVFFSEVEKNRKTSPIANIELAQMVQNFFTTDAQGQIMLKAYSREGANDYRKIIIDPQGRLAELVRMTLKELRKNKITLGSPEYKAFVNKQNHIGSQLTVIPQLSIGAVTYDSMTIPRYPSDILIATEEEWSKRKKQ